MYAHADMAEKQIDNLSQIHENTLRRQQRRDPAPNCYTRTYVSDGVTLSMDFYVSGQQLPEGAPGILFFFGGAFLSGCKEAFAPQAIELAKLGYVAACAEYRIKAVHGTDPGDSLRDGCCAWEFFLKTGREFGMNPECAVLSGGSAGAQLALCAARDTGIYPAAMILFNPALGLDENERFFTAEDLREGMPPILIFHGGSDQIIPPERIWQFARRAETLGIPVRVEIFPQMVHGFFNLNASRGHYFMTLGQMIAFLDEKIGLSRSVSVIL